MSAPFCSLKIRLATYLMRVGLNSPNDKPLYHLGPTAQSNFSHVARQHGNSGREATPSPLPCFDKHTGIWFKFSSCSAVQDDLKLCSSLGYRLYRFLSLVERLEVYPRGRPRPHEPVASSCSKPISSVARAAWRRSRLNTGLDGQRHSWNQQALDIVLSRPTGCPKH